MLAWEKTKFKYDTHDEFILRPNLPNRSMWGTRKDRNSLRTFQTTPSLWSCLVKTTIVTATRRLVQTVKRSFHIDITPEE